MIIKGKSRSGSRQLGNYLNSPGENEEVRTLEVRGTVAQDVPGAILELDTYALGTKCDMPLYHAMINPEPPNELSPTQCMTAVDTLEEKLGFNGHSRVVVLHEKHGRQHLHVVWTRIDLDTMTSVHMGHSYRKHEEASRELERQFGHNRVQGVHHERDGERPDRTPSRSELRQEARTGIKGKQVKEEVTAAFRASDGAAAFEVALAERGYLLARGDKRDYVVIDRAGGIHSLARRIDGMKAADLRNYMGVLDQESIPSVERARLHLQERKNELQGDLKKEKSYGQGEDYASQSTAALDDHKKRQKALEAKAQDSKVEDRLSKLDEKYQAHRSAQQTTDHSHDAGPSPQTPAPGRGRSRGR